MIDKYDYYCPKCNNILSKNNQVIFNIQRLNKETATLFLDPKPGFYNFKCEPVLDFVHKELVDFSCPHCKKGLESNKYSRFVEIILKVTNNVSFEVFFSRIYGDHRTFVGIEDFEEEYGDQIKKFQNS